MTDLRLPNSVPSPDHFVPNDSEAMQYIEDQEIPKEELLQTVNFLKRIGQAAINAPYQANLALQKFYISAQTNPWGTIRTGVEAGVVAAEVTPANEALRIGTAGFVQGATGNSLAAGLTFMLVTGLIEGAAAYATADLMKTGGGKKVFDWLHKKTDKVLKGRKLTDNPGVEMTVTYAGGSAVIMAAKKAENPDITHEELLTQGKFAASWLSPVVGIQWLTGANAWQNPTPANIALTVGSTVGLYTGAKVLQKVRGDNKSGHETQLGSVSKEWVSYNEKTAITSRLLSTEEGVLLTKATELEQKVWYQKDYGPLDDYRKYDRQSRVFAAFNSEGECMGMTRMFSGNQDSLPPFLEMDFYDQEQKTSLANKCVEGEVEELGTTAVNLKRAPAASTVNGLWRLAYREARDRGIKKWGIIMEPRRVRAMNKRYGFTFNQAGAEIEYQGGKCAPFVMDLEEVDASMQSSHPERYEWFVKEPL